MTANFEEIEKRLRIMEDIEEIRQLHARYLDAYGTYNVPVIYITGKSYVKTLAYSSTPSPRAPLCVIKERLP